MVASYGHVRDLASKSGSVKPQEDFALVWGITNGGETRLADIAAATAGCGSLVLATDPDREGEAISWHITEELKVRLETMVSPQFCCIFMMIFGMIW